MQLFVLDVAGGDKVPRKGGPGVTRSDLLVINKIDIAHLVNADLGVMERDAATQRGDLPTVFVSLTSPEGAAPIAAWIQARCRQTAAPWLTRSRSPASGWTDTEVSVRLRRGAGGTVRVDGVLCTAPLWFRWDGATLWLVGSGASPVGEDHIRVRVDVGPGVTVAVRSVAATVVYAARGAGTRWDTELHVADGARVDWRPEPVILTERARHEATTTVHASAGADVTLDEVLVLGRAGEATGHAPLHPRRPRRRRPGAAHLDRHVARPAGRVPPAWTVRRSSPTASASARRRRPPPAAARRPPRRAAPAGARVSAGRRHGGRRRRRPAIARRRPARVTSTRRDIGDRSASLVRCRKQRDNQPDTGPPYVAATRAPRCGIRRETLDVG